MNSLTNLKKPRVLTLLITPALIAATFTAMSARATPSCGVTNSNLLYPGQPVDSAHAAHFPDGLLNLLCNELQQYGWGIRTKVKGDSDVYVVQNTFPPGADSGWHTHPGPSLITVTAGTITAYEADSPNCTPKIYNAGDSFTDVGCGDVHLLRNEGSICAVTIVVQIVPAGQARRIDADQPPSCPAFTCPSPSPSPCVQ
ncbi:MAG TPA: cupin domain-containing protein [Candidatus Udaeobacter sp.]|jgi:quercetin dioxygenase-like cupin family protein|nr:cupin domain-containing protein [Candidatus Udaeobacter sp.]